MAPRKHLALLALLLLAAVCVPQAFSQEDDDDDDDSSNVSERISFELGSGASPIRILADYTHVTAGTTEFKSYVQNSLIPSIVSYFSKSLKVKHPVKSLISTKSSTLCGYPTPAALKTGVSADIIFLIGTVSSTSSWLGIATSCAVGVSGGVTKPLIVRIGINTRLMKIGNAVTDPLTHDLNINTLIHEFLHGFAVRGSLYKYFLDSDGKTLTNHVKSMEIGGETRTVLDLPALTKRLRNYYNCDSMPGMIMENGGGAHFERRYFAYDLMSNGGLIDSKMTEFDLGFLEGTGWYVPDYSYAEPYFFGKGEGCDFIFGDCDSEKFNDFCSNEDEKGCGITGLGGGKCTSDSKLGGRCKYVLTQRSFNCEHPTGTAYTTFGDKQIYGRGFGSKCFTGNITAKSATVKQNTYCFTYTCTNSGKTLRVDFGPQTFDCTQEGPMKIFNYNGFINCPDPVKFCNTIGKPTCPKNCMGQGTCVSGKCQCDSGWQGTNCAFKK